MPYPKRNVGQALGFRSGLEVDTAAHLKALGVNYRYEEVRLAYVKPETPATYTPDFLLDNGIVVETKGRFMPDDRKKHVLLKAQHPGLDIRFVFSRSSTKISKASKTSYADWCVKNGFKFADKQIPQAWLNESACSIRIAAIKTATK
jgi:hypothetical protein